MKKTLIALAILGTAASVAQAQSAVTVYGVLDVGVSKTTGKTTSMGAGNNNKLGFKGVEDLGGGLAAMFQTEIRFDPDTGTVEGGNRPLFQGESRVGLKGDFGQVRLGRGLTAMQESTWKYDPWGNSRGRGTFNPRIISAGYGSAPLDGKSPADNTSNRFSNALFYNSPVMGGFQANVTVATKEDGRLTTSSPRLPVPVGSLPGTVGALLHAEAIPFSVSGTYENGPLGALLAYERNALSDKFWQLGAFYKVGPAKLMASYAQTEFGSVNSFDAYGLPAAAATIDSKTKAWLLGAVIDAGPGNILVGYGEKRPDNFEKVKQASVGYQYNLSKRTFLYTDAINVRGGNARTANTFDVGIHHNF
ncbi:MAG: porin [Burkholderiaceae bacterium]